MPLAQLARTSNDVGRVEIAREDGQRCISVEVNVRGRKVGTFAQEAQAAVARENASAHGLHWSGL
jgi:cobalt-zinc-cadmium resistance protein CzcA